MPDKPKRKRRCRLDSIATRKPWLLDGGISRRTWFRRQARLATGTDPYPHRGGARTPSRLGHRDPNAIIAGKPDGMSASVWYRRCRALRTTVELKPVSLRIRAQAARFLQWRADLAEQHAAQGLSAAGPPRTAPRPRSMLPQLQPQVGPLTHGC
jgi:hypothetical protein